jgi:transcriptional regulator with XRE-family HTH domain
MLMNITALAANLERLRRKAGLNKKELAAKAGMKNASILTLYEQARVENPGMDNLAKLATALEVTVDELLTDRRVGTRDGDAVLVTPSMEEKMQEIALQTSKSVLQQWVEDHSNQIPTTFKLAPVQNFDTMGVPERKGRPLPDGVRLAKVYDLRAAADVGRILLHDDGGGEPVEVVMYEASSQGYEGSEVIGLHVHGDCLAPVVADGALILVEVERPGFPLADLDAAVGDIVFACVGEAMHVKFLLRADGGYVLAPLNGEPPIPVDEDVQVVGVVIEQRSRPRWPGKQ